MAILSGITAALKGGAAVANRTIQTAIKKVIAIKNKVFQSKVARKIIRAVLTTPPKLVKSAKRHFQRERRLGRLSIMDKKTLYERGEPEKIRPINIDKEVSFKDKIEPTLKPIPREEIHAPEIEGSDDELPNEVIELPDTNQFIINNTKKEKKELLDNFKNLSKIGSAIKDSKIGKLLQFFGGIIANSRAFDEFKLRGLENTVKTMGKALKWTGSKISKNFAKNAKNQEAIAQSQVDINKEDLNTVSGMIQEDSEALQGNLAEGFSELYSGMEEIHENVNTHREEDQDRDEEEQERDEEENESESNFRSFVKGQLSSLGGMLTSFVRSPRSVVDAIKEQGDLLADSIGNTLGVLAGIKEKIEEPFKKVTDVFKEHFKPVTEMVVNMLPALKTGLFKVMIPVYKAIIRMAGWLVNKAIDDPEKRIKINALIHDLDEVMLGGDLASKEYVSNYFDGKSYEELSAEERNRLTFNDAQKHLTDEEINIDTIEGSGLDEESIQRLRYLGYIKTNKDDKRDYIVRGKESLAELLEKKIPFRALEKNDKDLVKSINKGKVPMPSYVDPNSYEIVQLSRNLDDGFERTNSSKLKSANPDDRRLSKLEGNHKMVRYSSVHNIYGKNEEGIKILEDGTFIPFINSSTYRELVEEVTRAQEELGKDWENLPAEKREKILFRAWRIRSAGGNPYKDLSSNNDAYLEFNSLKNSSVLEKDLNQVNLGRVLDERKKGEEDNTTSSTDVVPPSEVNSTIISNDVDTPSEAPIIPSSIGSDLKDGSNTGENMEETKTFLENLGNTVNNALGINKGKGGNKNPNGTNNGTKNPSPNIFNQIKNFFNTKQTNVNIKDSGSIGEGGNE